MFRSAEEKLRAASEKGDLAEVRRLLNEGVDVNCTNDIGWTALLEASYYGHVDIVKALLEKNAKIDLQDNYGNTALTYASNNGYVDIVNLLKAVRTFIAISHPHPCPQQTHS